jgi:hypothetical protein
MSLRVFYRYLGFSSPSGIVDLLDGLGSGNLLDGVGGSPLSVATSVVK